MPDSLATSWVNAQIRDKIIACGGTPVVTDMLAVNAYNLLLSQLLGILCCGACAGGGAYSQVVIEPGQTEETSHYAWGPAVSGDNGFGLGAFTASQPALLVPAAAEPFQFQFAQLAGDPVTATYNIPASALTVNGGWIDSITFINLGGVVWAHQIVTSLMGASGDTLVPYIINNAASGAFAGQLQIVAGGAPA